MRVVVSKSEGSITASRKIRNEVFTQEQGIPMSLDLDGLDAASYHGLAYLDDIVIGVARLTLTDGDNAVMARVAVKKEYRGKGVARQIIESLISKSKQLGVVRIEIHPHEHLREYYETFGFQYVKQLEKVADHKLIEMFLSQDTA